MTDENIPHLEPQHVEKTCSRCGRFNWDSLSGCYKETCKDGKPCDTNGAVYVDGKPKGVV